MRWYLRSLVRSFYDLSFYHEVWLGWRGWGLGLITITYCILTFIGVVVGSALFHTYVVADEADGKPGKMEVALRQIAAQWPKMRINNSIIEMKSEQPHIIHLHMGEGEWSDMAVITIDTTGNTTHDNMTTPVLITDKDFITKTDRETKVKSLSEFFKDAKGPINLDAQVMDGYMKQVIETVHATAIFIYLIVGAFILTFMIPVLLMMRMCLVLPVALLGLGIMALMKEKMDYSACVRVINTVLVPITIIDAFCFILLQSGVSVWLEVVIGIGILVLVSVTKPSTATA